MVTGKRVFAVILVLIFAVGFTARADDGDDAAKAEKAAKKEQERADKAAKKAEKEAAEQARKDEKEAAEQAKKAEKQSKENAETADKEERHGNVFTRFWTHTVGATIGNGLKSGASKINSASGSGGAN